ncbi:tail protein [Pantoea phage Nafs113]|nr:tail protein [Pantoea phage Nafs113]
MPMFGRQIEVIIGLPGSEGVKITEVFHVSGRFTRTSGSSANKGEFTVTGLKDDTVRKMQTPGAVVIFKAGYLQDHGPVTFFAGTITRIEPTRDGTDDNVVIELMDSVIPLRDAKISGSFPPNTSALKILDYVSGQFGLPVRKNLKIADRQMVRAFAYNGRARNAMNEICQFLGLEWSAQGNEIQIIKKGDVYSDVAVVLSHGTGLLGSPKPKAKNMIEKGAAKKGIKYGQDGVIRFTKTDPSAKIKDRQMLQVQGYSVESLMNPMIYPGALVQLYSRGVDGKFFRVEACEYEIDTHSGNFLVRAELRAVDSK